MMQYVYDFLSIFFDKLKEKEKIRAIILFGSFARNDARKDSDIDLFIDVVEKNKLEVEKILKESINEFELKARKIWNLRGINNSIVPIIDNLYLERWNELRGEISTYSIIIYGKFIDNDKKNKNFVLIEYDLSKTKQKNKMKILRKLYGYKLKKGNKTYEQKGIIDEFKAEKLLNSLLIPLTNYKKAINLFRDNKIPIKIRRIWTG